MNMAGVRRDPIFIWDEIDAQACPPTAKLDFTLRSSAVQVSKSK